MDTHAHEYGKSMQGGWLTHAHKYKQFPFTGSNDIKRYRKPF